MHDISRNFNIDLINLDRIARMKKNITKQIKIDIFPKFKEDMSSYIESLYQMFSRMN